MSDSNLDPVVRFGTTKGSRLRSIVFVHGLQGHPYKTWASKHAKKRIFSDVVLQPGNDGALSKQKNLPGDRLFRRFLPTRAFPSKKRRSCSTTGKGLESNNESPVTKSSWSESPCTIVNSLGEKAKSTESAIVHTLSVSRPNVFWPADLLPAECPNARILTWGYDTMVTKYMKSASNKSTIFSHGKNLLFALGQIRPRGRRIILVAHSLGGVVVKEVRVMLFLINIESSRWFQRTSPFLGNLLITKSSTRCFPTPQYLQTLR